MSVKAIFTCDLCKKEVTFSGPGALDNVKPWQALPYNGRSTYNRKINPYKPWENEFGQFDHYALEWVCSRECMAKWVELDPDKRVIFIPDKDYYCDDGWAPTYVIRKTKKYIWLGLYNAQINLKTGNWTGRGGYMGRCHGKLREEDRARLFKICFKKI